MREALLIARREYLERVRSQAFRVSTILIPLVFVAIFAMSAFSGAMPGTSRHIVVASNDLVLADNVRMELLRTGPSASTSTDALNLEQKKRRSKQGKIEIDVMAPVSESDLDALNAQVRSGDLDGYLWLRNVPGKTMTEATYVSLGSVDAFGDNGVFGADGINAMRSAIGKAVAREELAQGGAPGLQSDVLLHRIDLNRKQAKGGQSTASNSDKSFWGAYILALVLYFAVIFYGMNVAQSVVAEKTSRVFEVLLATTRPESLMAGKLIGVGAAGLTQMAVWAGGLLLLGLVALGGRVGRDSLAAVGITPTQFVFFLIYFLLGFFFYSALSAGFGATVSQESDVQQFSMVLVMPQLVGLVLMVYILDNPAAWPVVLLSLIPPCTPIVMCLRMAAMAVPWWQILLSLVLMVASTYGALWVASRIYRVGILMYGKRPTLPEMLRWISYS